VVQEENRRVDSASGWGLVDALGSRRPARVGDADSVSGPTIRINPGSVGLVHQTLGHHEVLEAEQAIEGRSRCVHRSGSSRSTTRASVQPRRCGHGGPAGPSGVERWKVLGSLEFGDHCEEALEFGTKGLRRVEA
jgi:hypothetical protein